MVAFGRQAVVFRKRRRKHDWDFVHYLKSCVFLFVSLLHLICKFFAILSICYLKWHFNHSVMFPLCLLVSPLKRFVPWLLKSFVFRSSFLGDFISFQASHIDSWCVWCSLEGSFTVWGIQVCTESGGRRAAVVISDPPFAHCGAVRFLLKGVVGLSALAP